MKCPDCSLDNIAGSDECSGCGSPLVHTGALAPKRGMERRILEGTAKDLSPKTAKAVSPRDSLLKAVEMMRAANVGCVLVFEHDNFRGILSERDLILKVPETQDLAQSQVASVMRERPTCLRENDEIAVVFNLMAMSGNWHAPVQMNNGSYGVVSARDLLRYLCK